MSRRVICRECRLLVLTGALVWSLGVVALDDAEVTALEEKCEAAREEALAPIREDRTRACVEQQLRRMDNCERYYATYGNVSRSPTGAPTTGYFYDLPECQEWLEAREQLRQSRSRN